MLRSSEHTRKKRRDFSLEIDDKHRCKTEYYTHDINYGEFLLINESTDKNGDADAYGKRDRAEARDGNISLYESCEHTDSEERKCEKNAAY